MRRQKKLIERAYREGESLGFAVWGQDEAGPFGTEPYGGRRWSPQSQPQRHAHEHQRNGTAKLLTLFHPASGRVRVKGVTTTVNPVLHGWLKAELTAILATMPEPTFEATRAHWTQWQEGLSIRITLPSVLPPLRMLLVLDNLAGHKTPELVLWLFAHGVMPLYTPVSGSWLNMIESMQRILKRRALEGYHPSNPEQIITWLEATACGWNEQPTPFIWNGKRTARRVRSRERRHAVGGSGVCTRRPLSRRTSVVEKWRRARQVTH